MKSVWLSIESISNNVVNDHGDVVGGADDGAAPEAVGGPFSFILRSGGFCCAPVAAPEAAGIGAFALGPSPVRAALGTRGLGSAIALAMTDGDIHTPTW